MPATYEPIATTTLGSAATTITFSAIGSTYTDLRLVFVCNTDSTINEFFYMTFNSDGGTNYSNTRMNGNGSSAFSARTTSSTSIEAGRASGNTGIFSLTNIDIFSYAGSTNKTVLCDSNCDLNGSGSVWRIVGLWRNTAAITSITLTSAGGVNFKTGTTATLYGILKA